MSNKKAQNSRLRLSAGMCILIGLLLGFVVKNVRIGLLVGLALGLLGGAMLSKRD